eukprot:CAMPEP_0198356220 /NCGR_PEP_ID=MMETSP1450-20131203/122020_1 /TAXON_ID=753684 ORGANISM="Madagascaria erythrocladiodes, Strain CCMP3234" /NCGR_SAMPLE_ID=MMETSP1450 /ASSEMBLY_ACC=CAM_ASM_001115 /LENGTH=181 /DNA_ID=CAMNT_0044062687 /DNA_START=86 /DNA_END=628 /DNA_ORIENTATION=-
MRFVDTLKVGKVPPEKSRLVVQGTKDAADDLSRSSPTMSRCTLRLICMVAVILDLELWTVDITQAYTHTGSRLQRPVFAKAPKELGLPPGYILKVVGPLYGLAEAGVHLYAKLRQFLQTYLFMSGTVLDFCLYTHARQDGQPDAVVGTQVDDILGASDPSFLRRLEQALRRSCFPVKPTRR